MSKVKVVVVSFIVLIVSIFVGVSVNDSLNSTQLQSNNLNKWLNKGKYFMYKDTYKIFYVLESVKENGVDHDDQNDGREVITNLFLHGFPTSSYDYVKIWKQFLEKIDEFKSYRKKFRYQLVAFDYIGFGFSDKPLNYNYSLFDQADLVERLLIHLNVGKINLITHDIGDSVAQELIRRYNLAESSSFYQINSCVMLNGGIFISIYQPVLSQTILLSHPFVAQLFARFFFNSITFPKVFSKVFGTLNKPSDSDLKEFYEVINYKDGRLTLPLTIHYLDERFEYDEVWRNALNETHVPIMFIYGPADPINPANKFVDKMRNELPLVKFRKLSDLIGHYPQWEDPFTVFQLTAEFVYSNEPKKLEKLV